MDIFFNGRTSNLKTPLKLGNVGDNNTEVHTFVVNCALKSFSVSVGFEASPITE